MAAGGLGLPAELLPDVAHFDAGALATVSLSPAYGTVSQLWDQHTAPQGDRTDTSLPYQVLNFRGNCLYDGSAAGGGGSVLFDGASCHAGMNLRLCDWEKMAGGCLMAVGWGAGAAAVCILRAPRAGSAATSWHARLASRRLGPSGNTCHSRLPWYIGWQEALTTKAMSEMLQAVCACEQASRHAGGSCDSANILKPVVRCALNVR